MKYAIALAAAAATALVATSASAYERHGKVVGPNGGVYEYGAKGGCADGVCTRESYAKGPHGDEWSRKAVTVKRGNGYDRYIRVEGPNGVYKRKSRVRY